QPRPGSLGDIARLGEEVQLAVVDRRILIVPKEALLNEPLVFRWYKPFVQFLSAGIESLRGKAVQARPQGVQGLLFEHVRLGRRGRGIGAHGIGPHDGGWRRRMRARATSRGCRVHIPPEVSADRRIAPPDGWVKVRADHNVPAVTPSIPSVRRWL